MTKDRVRYLMGPTLHACAFELGAMAAYLVREAFLSFLLVACFCRCNYHSRRPPSQSAVFAFMHLWVILGHGNKASSKPWHLFNVSTY